MPPEGTQSSGLFLSAEVLWGLQFVPVCDIVAHILKCMNIFYQITRSDLLSLPLINFSCCPHQRSPIPRTDQKSLTITSGPLTLLPVQLMRLQRGFFYCSKFSKNTLQPFLSCSVRKTALKTHKKVAIFRILGVFESRFLHRTA